MTTTTSVTNSQSIIDALNASSSSTKTTSASQSAQDRFLTLLTAQLKNQDPLNPLDNAQMTSQLAQISTVDGITKLNNTVNTLLSQFNQVQSLQAASLVSHGVMVPGNGLQLANGGAVGAVDIAAAADTVTVTIKDSNGLAVRTLNLGAQDAGTIDFTWDGRNDAGVAAANGMYTISVKANQGSNAVGATGLQLGVVSAVTLGSHGLNLEVGSLGSFTMADVKQIL